MEVDHDFVVVEEFDALSIEVKVPPKPAPAAAPAKTPSPKPISSVTPPPAATPAPAPTPAPAKPAATPAKPSAPTPAAPPRSGRPLCDGWLSAGRFPAKEHAQKVAKELGVQSGLIYLPGQEDKLYEYSDMGPEFRQRRHFYYLSGAEHPGCSVTYDIARDILILWVPFTDPKTALWFGTTPTIDEYKAITAVDDVRLNTGLERFVMRTLSPGSILYVLDPDQKPKLSVTRGATQIDTSKLRAAIEAARVIKSDYEVNMIRRANTISSAAHKAIQARLKRLSNEREIDAIFRGFCLAQAAKHQAYPIIAGSGKNAACLHYEENNSELEGKQLVIVDAGAEWHCYASDITRTLPIYGKFSTEAQAVYSIVERMQEECIQRIKPGVEFHTLHLHACIVAVTELLKLGILHGGTASEIFNRGTVAAFFPHGLGHHVGLEVHDVSGYEKLMVGSASVGIGAGGAPGIGGKIQGRDRHRFKREWMSPEMLSLMYRDTVHVGPPYKNRQKLEKNMVVTIEPGIYFNRDYIKAYFLNNPLHAKYINTTVLEKYWDVGGVRIEDCILVTDTGYENLTTAPKGEEMLKVING